MVYTINEITDRLTPVFEQNGVTKAILFGSYAKGTATEESDVDLVIETEPYVRGLKFYGILGNIMDALEKQVDLVSSTSIIPNGEVDLEVAQSGKVIYER
jgi:predicted nucleotidyltransferase